MTLIRKSIISALSAIIISGGRFLLMAILARRLSTTEFGQFVYALWLIDMAFMICAFGLNGAASRYLAEYAHEPSRRAVFLRSWLPWALMLPVLSGLVVVAGAILSGLLLTQFGYVLLAAWTMSNGWWAMQTAALSGYQRFDLILSANLTSIVIVIPAALFIPIDRGFTELLFSAMALSSLCACLFGVRLNATLMEGFAAAKTVALPWPMIRAYAVNMWLVGLLASLVWSRGELPLVRSHLGDEGVAEYTVALTLFFGAMQGIMLWVSGIAPHLTSEWGRGQKAQAIAVVRRFSDIQLLLSGCFALLLTCFGPEILGVIFGETYRTSATSLSILVLGLITLSASAQNHLLQIDTDAKFSRNTSLIGVVILFSIASFTIPWLGVAGAAIARAVTMWSLFLITLILVWRTWGHTAFSGRNAMVVVCAVLAPALIIAGGEIHFVFRALFALLCLATLALFIRSEAGRLVAIETAKTLWFRLLQRAATVKK